MSKPAAHPDLASLIGQVDDLSTRLIIDGVASIAPSDFECLGHAAAALGNSAAAEAAHRIAASVASSFTRPAPELTRIASSGLMELRHLLGSSVAPKSFPLEPRPEATCELPPPSSGGQPLAEDEGLVREFILESSEHLSSIESQILILEQDHADPETLNAIFRSFHTIKGLAGFLQFATIQSTAHEVETLLDLARISQLTLTAPVVDVILESTDVLRQELAAIELKLAGKTPPPSKVDGALLERIRRSARGEAGSRELVSAPIATLESAKQNTPPSPPATPAAAEAPKEGAAEPQRQERRPGDGASVRIETAKLDQLMDTVGELVIAQTMIGHNPALQSARDARLQRSLDQFARITADVQRIATAMRMVPIGIQFNKTARMVRDLARRCGKQILFEAAGEDTELDKTIAEELSDPLLHMVRNAIDHGIETPEERIALGKEPTARIRVSACHRSGQIVITISDDGRGLNREKILARAREKCLIDPSAPPLRDNEIDLLIFEPGFSTAETITDISGRGVGMDVVRRQVQKLRGRIDIQSRTGEGTAFSIKLPLTLAIIEGLIVAVGTQCYIVPIHSVREMFRPTPDMLSTVQGTAEMAMVRGALLPIVRLHRRLGTGPRTERLTEGTLIVAESEGQRFCLFVDDLIGKQEVVIKSLGPRFKGVSGIAGCAILGNGGIGLILDIDALRTGRV